MSTHLGLIMHFQRNNLNFDLLSDLDRSVTKAYDLLFEGLGGIEGYTCSNRGIVIIDSEGIIQYRWVAEPNPGLSQTMTKSRIL